MTETDRYGRPLQGVTAEEVVEYLKGCDRETLLAIIAAMIVCYMPYQDDVVMAIMKEVGNGR